MKKILLLGTGGTIASEPGQNGLVPRLDPSELAGHVRELAGLCSFECRELFSIDSTNITPAHWLAIARAIRESFDDYDGFVITHGTDTMAYTAAALSYLIQNSPKPIVLTGAQKPILYENTDSRTNLADAFRCAISNLRGVMIVFNGKIILGTRACKIRTTSYEAFSSINYPLLGVVQDGCLLEYIVPPCLETPAFYETLDPKVSLLKLVPGIDAGVLSYLLERSDALIIESFGVGGLPSFPGSEFYELIRRATAEQGKTVVMTTQVQNEGSNLAVYDVGYSLKHELNLLEAYDMTTEAVLAKLMWILGQTKEKERIRELFYRPVAMDLLKQ